MLNTLLMFLLSPLLILQGVWTRYKTEKLPEPKGDRSGNINCSNKFSTNKTLTMWVIGDSAAAGVGVESQKSALTGLISMSLSKRHNVNWQFIAKTSYTTHDMLNHLSNIKHQPVDLVICSLGVNDVTSFISKESWLLKKELLIRRLIKNYKAKLIIMSSLPPMGKFPALPQPLRYFLGQRADQFSLALLELCERYHGVIYLPFDQPLKAEFMATDGFHPGKEIYRQWAERVTGCIENELNFENDKN
ncbi:MAG: SGNH/GDSL hydrolase family protein [Gammaproteobacteria bacterium]|nr:SGNH/GDSL hydrolase family protein [Gammaproteobacteria bacterium]